MPITVRSGAYLHVPLVPSPAPAAPISFNPTGSAITVSLPRPSAGPSSSAPASANSTTPDDDGALQSTDLDAQDTFFDELYETIMNPAIPPATTTVVSIPPPRSTTTFTNLTTGNPIPDLDLTDEALSWATEQSPQPQSQYPQTICTHQDCPIAPRYHLQGIYIHEGIPPPNHLATFGRSNPPPNVWQAIYNGCNWVGTQADADRISRFIEYHAIGGNFLLAPHTNFLWGEEINTPYAVAPTPVVSLPFPALPCRVYFDAAPNLMALPELPYIRDIDNPAFRRCVDPGCPIAGEHGQGKYLHHGEPPCILSVAFGHSNPPLEVWEALERVARARHYGLKASNADRWVVDNFQKLHVCGNGG
ncbi:MAG: hypothetical protein Q9184_003264 [Pyrenodesmia sp. 2 TL-2023]